MNAKALRILEYEKIIDLLEKEATSDGGRALCRDLKPMDELAEIEVFQQETEDAYNRVVKQGSISCAGTFPVSEILTRMAMCGVLNTTELLRIAYMAETAATVKRYDGSTREETKDSLTELFHALEPMQDLSHEIRRCILGEDEIADDASPTLRHIRREISMMDDKVHATLSHLLNGSYAKYLQEPIITMRGDRFCLPIKAEFKNQVSGMVHDQSSSGMTLFIEPMAVVKLNNDLKELYAQEADEIQVILGRLSSEASAYSGSIRQNYEVLTALDFIFARARLALNMNATRPIMNEAGYVKIRKGRHPLLDPKKVVPIDLELGRDFTLLIVTGPNTGGKTVSLKTMGLFCLMAQAGLHVPAADRTELARFHEVYADIGDEQSIEQSLSTFSSHMTNIVEILSCVQENDLVLFDELGAGTDPTEGAALAISILDALHQRNIRAMATTHYAELKVYALTAEGVTNACCEFDVATLRPTYRILVGVPGKSNAFAISGKLGLPEEIIASAKARMNAADISFEDLLSDLEHSRSSMEKDQDEISRLRAQLEKERAAIAKQREQMLEEAREEASAILREAREDADEAMREFRRKDATQADLDRARSKLRKKHEASVRTEVTTSSFKPEDFHPGDTIKVLSMNVKGTVTQAADKDGMIGVQMGIIKTRRPASDLELIPDEPVVKKHKSTGTGASQTKMQKSMTVSGEINLLGKTVDEACIQLDKYIDDAVLAHLSFVRIVHGKGTGALRNGIHRYLRCNRNVKSFRLGGFGEGDAGVTVVELE